MIVADSRVAEKTSALAVEAGLFVLRYSSSAASQHPTIYVRSSPGSERSLAIMFAPNAGGVLDRPGRCAVLAVSEACAIQVTVRASRVGGSLDAKIEIEQLEKLENDRVLTDLLSEDLRKVNGSLLPALSSPALRLQGHVARRGDVATKVGAWLAGPADPARIEGIAIAVTDTDNLLIEYQVMLANETQWSAWYSQGSYAGSRGRSVPIIGLRLRLSGIDERKFSIFSSALFLGSQVIEKSGADLEFRSMAGNDPLIGLLVDLKPFVDQALTRGGGEIAPTASRVRVFRAGQESIRA